MPSPQPAKAANQFHGELIDVWTWEQELFDGSTHVFECITRPDTAAILTFLDPETVLLTKQQQPGRGAFIDTPGGRVDHGEDAQQAAIRELGEETGKFPHKVMCWDQIQRSGVVRFEEHLFIGCDLTETERHLDPGEKIELFPISWADLVQLALKRGLRNHSMNLAILQMEFDPEAKKRLREFLM